MKSVPLKKFKAYLKSKGCYCKRTKGSHEIWDLKNGSLDRPLTVDNNYPDVPITHIKTNLSSLGISNKEFENEIIHF